MTHNTKLNAALLLAGAALALSIYAAVRAPAGAGAAHVCVDREARDQSDKLRQALAQRDALIARLTRAASAPAGVPAAQAAGDAPAGSRLPPPPSSPPASRRGPKRFTHFEVPNPAVTVTQKDDGTYDIRTTDPALSGTTMQITAVTATGDEDTLFIRIP